MTKDDAGAHGLWRRDTSTLFYVHIFNLDTGSYLHMTPEKALAKAEKDKKDICLHYCLDCRCHLTPLLLSAERITEKEEWASTWKIASQLGFNLKREYYETCGFVQERMALDVVRSNTLLLRVPLDKETRIC